MKLKTGPDSQGSLLSFLNTLQLITIANYISFYQQYYISHSKFIADKISSIFPITDKTGDDGI